ncbi:MAG TPA: hypothetical protein VFP56_11730, partial [Candidatus Limnocylindrales bacterium]|nr:hypothetical protein [Candidatus Limnocylindrales bacterium]
MRGRLGAVVVALAAGSVGAAPAFAGTYDVHACATPGGKFSNHSWAISVNGSQFARTSCSASDARPYIWVGSAADKLYNPGQGAAMTFTAPSGATIANFWLHRYLHHFNPIDGNTDREYLYTVAQLGGTMFESGGH